MPSSKEHREHTFSIYGVDGASIHKWMDEPWRLYGPSHRKVRHDKNQELPQALIDEHGAKLAKNIMIDHILLDQGQENNEKDDLEQLAETISVLREKLEELYKTINSKNREINALKNKAYETKEKRRKWKRDFIEKWCDVYSEMLEETIKKFYIYKGTLEFRCPDSLHEKTINEIENFYKCFYLFDAPYDRRWNNETIIEDFGYEVMISVFETIRKGVNREVAVFEKEMLNNRFDDDLK